MTKKPTDHTETPAADADANEGAQKLQLSVKRMKKLRVSVKGGADSWTSVVQPTSAPPPGGTASWTNNAELNQT